MQQLLVKLVLVEKKQVAEREAWVELPVDSEQLVEKVAVKQVPPF